MVNPYITLTKSAKKIINHRAWALARALRTDLRHAAFEDYQTQMQAAALADGNINLNEWQPVSGYCSDDDVE